MMFACIFFIPFLIFYFNEMTYKQNELNIYNKLCLYSMQIKIAVLRDK